MAAPQFKATSQPRVPDYRPASMTVTAVHAPPVVVEFDAPGRYERWVKRPLDRAIGLLLLLALLPVLVLVALGIWLTMGRPILFKQYRVGFLGKPFVMYKFRSMRDAPADEAGTFTHTTSDDQRHTSFGRFMRAAFTRRAATAAQCGSRRDEPGRAPSRDRRNRRTVRSDRSPPSSRSTGHDRPVADLRVQGHRSRARARRPRRLLRAQLLVSTRCPHRVPHDPGRLVSPVAPLLAKAPPVNRPLDPQRPRWNCC